MLKRITPERFNQFLIIKRSTHYVSFLNETLCDCEIYEMTEDEEQAKEQKKPQEKPKQAQKKQVDRGRVMALYNGNWKVKDIAEDCGCSEATVYTILKQLTKEGMITRKEAADGGNA